MSVRLRPTVRCAFDEAQGALRVTLKEPVEETQGEQVVIYALRVRFVYPCHLYLFTDTSPYVERKGVEDGVLRICEGGGRERAAAGAGPRVSAPRLGRRGRRRMSSERCHCPIVIVIVIG